MPAPTTYTESSLLDFMHTELSNASAALGFETNDDALVQAVTAVERLLGVSDVATATDMALVEAAARWQAWVAAASASTPDTNLKAGSASLELQQRFGNIQVKLDAAYGFYLIEKARVAAATGTGVFAFATIPGRRGR